MVERGLRILNRSAQPNLQESVAACSMGYWLSYTLPEMGKEMRHAQNWFVLSNKLRRYMDSAHESLVRWTIPMSLLKFSLDRTVRVKGKEKLREGKLWNYEKKNRVRRFPKEGKRWLHSRHVNRYELCRNVTFWVALVFIHDVRRCENTAHNRFQISAIETMKEQSYTDKIPAPGVSPFSSSWAGVTPFPRGGRVSLRFTLAAKEVTSRDWWLPERSPSTPL